MQLIETNDSGYSDEIASMYIQAFSTGISQQHIDFAELKLYINLMLKEGSALLAVENNTVCGAILIVPAGTRQIAYPTIFVRTLISKNVFIWLK
ncbi:MAG: hypothetical protein QM800_06285 [Paludibacter sp.]